MENKDLFAAPSKEELLMFADPTEEELGGKSSGEPSTLEEIGQTGGDFARAGGSGLLFGGLEEAIAGAKAVTSSEEGDLADLYRKYLEIEEEKTREAKERSPVAFTVGEIGGSLLPAVLTGGAGLLPTAGRAAVKLTGKELAKAAARGAISGAKTGVVGGAVGGALTSEGGLIGATEEEKQKLLEDVGVGALSGGVLGTAFGGGMPYISSGVSALTAAGKKALQSTLLGEEIATAREMGKAGKGFITKASREARDVEKTTAIDEIKNTFLKIENQAAEEFKAPLRAADEAGIRIKPKFDIDSKEGFKLSNFFASEGESEIAEKLNRLASSGLGASESYELRRQIKEAAERNPKLLSSARTLVRDIDDSIESAVRAPEMQTLLQQSGLPGSYKEGLKTYSKVLQATTESITESGKPLDARRRFFHDLPASEATLFEKLTSVVNRLALPGTTSEEAVRTLYSKEGGLVPLLENLIKNENPEALRRIAKGLGFKSADELKESLVGKIQKTAKESSVKRVIQGEREIASGVPTFGALSELLTRKPLVTTANILGQTERAAQAVAKTTPVKIAKSIYKLPDTGLRALADKLEQSGGKSFSSFGANLRSAIDNGDTVKKQAILFSLMQNPKFREDFSDAVLEEGEE